MGYVALSAVLFGFGVPCLVLGGADRSFPNFSCLLSWLVVLYSSLRMGSYAARGEKRLLNLTFWVFVYIFLGLAPLVELMTRTFIMTGRYSSGEINTTLILICLSLIAYEVGAYLGETLRVPPSLTRFMLGRRISEGRTYALVLLVPVTTAVLVHVIGGPLMLFLPRSDFQSNVIVAAGSSGLAEFGVVMRLLRIPPYIAMLFLWACYLDYSRTHRGRIVWRYLLPLALLGLLNAVVSNPIAADRLWVGTIGLSVIFFTFKWQRRAAYFVWTATMIFVFVFLFQYMDMFRYTIEGRPVEIDSKALAQQFTVEKLDYSEFQVMVQAVRYADQNGITRGREFLGAMLFWFPRSVWKHKPHDSGAFISDEKGWGRYPAIALPLVGEEYLDWGSSGVALIFLLYGLGSMLIQRVWLEAEAPGTSVAQVLVPVLAPLQIYLLRGSLFSATNYILPILVCMFALTRRNPEPVFESMLRELRPAPDI